MTQCRKTSRQQELHTICYKTLPLPLDGFADRLGTMEYDQTLRSRDRTHAICPMLLEMA